MHSLSETVHNHGYQPTEDMPCLRLHPLSVHSSGCALANQPWLECFPHGFAWLQVTPIESSSIGLCKSLRILSLYPLSWHASKNLTYWWLLQIMYNSSQYKLVNLMLSQCSAFSSLFSMVAWCALNSVSFKLLSYITLQIKYHSIASC